MKTKIYLLFALLICITTAADAQKKGKKDNSLIDSFLLKGKIHEVDMFEETVKDASETHIVIYQEKEIYVAFFAQKDGSYEFYLPYGHEYEIWFGGSAFVNKKVKIDAKPLIPGKEIQPVVMDIGLFRPLDGHEFPLLNDPFVVVTYDEATKTLVPDIESAEAKSDELAKIFRKIKKEMPKKSKTNM